MSLADQTPPAILSSGQFRIAQTDVDLRAGLVRRNGHEDRLEPRLAGVIALLVQHTPEAVTRDMFLEIVWDGEGSDEALTQAISRLRRIFGDATAIKTHPRIGYSLAAPVAAVTGEPVATQATPSEASASPAPKGPVWKLGIAAAAISTFIVAGFLIGRFWPSSPGEQEFIPFEQEVEFVPQAADGGLVMEVVREGADGEPEVEQVRKGADGELEVIREAADAETPSQAPDH